jgi:hypothetical protein
MPVEIESFTAPGKYEIDKAMEEIKERLKYPNLVFPYIQYLNGHKIDGFPKESLYKRMQNK